MKRLIITLTLAATAVASVAGCGSDDKKAAPKGPEVAWAAKVCDTVNQSTAKLALPAVSSDVKVYRKNIVTFLDDVASRLKSMEANLQGVGSPPVEGGQASVDKALANLRATRTSLEQARVRLAKVKVENKGALQAEMQKLSKVMAKSATYHGPADDLKASNPKLGAAFNDAASCKTTKS
ncbi:hypothetical protein [Actinomadura macrotermitis]|uniref:Small secreted protein n=1 Tax=Actinomadura macrotermitis TaxID=2585200 RepID=A0A7K0BUA8_9ACTN|nr:hypothetical protein [Actinomadura macrotermitis]MQY04778.1 hypothetical protein [Actinomadura macrotermitis]